MRRGWVEWPPASHGGSDRSWPWRSRRPCSRSPRLSRRSCARRCRRVRQRDRVREREPGTDPEIWDIDGAGDPDIQGFATEISVNRGARIDFKIDTAADVVQIDIYRTGWYQRLGRPQDRSRPSSRAHASADPAGLRQRRGPPSSTTAATGPCRRRGRCRRRGLRACTSPGSSAPTASVTATSSSSSATTPARSDLFFQTSDTTWQAYNTYGGANFYQGGAAGPGATRSPTTGRSPRATRQTERDFFFSTEYPMVRFLERNGYDVSYIAGVDTDRRGHLLSNHGRSSPWATTSTGRRQQRPTSRPRATPA